MAEIRLSKLIKQFNIGLDTLVDFLNSKGAGIEDANPNLKVSDEFLPELHKKFGSDLKLKEEADKVDVKLTEILDKASKKQDDEAEEFEPERVTVIKSNNLSRIQKPVIPAEEPEEVVIPSEASESPKPEVKHVHRRRRRKRGWRKFWKVFWRVFLAIAIILVIAVIAIVVIGRVAPEWLDYYLYSPEEFEILHNLD
jgi:hypothetical protein